MRSPYFAFIRQPITYTTILMVAVWMIWFGATLLTIKQQNPPVGYIGPRLLMGLRAWGWCFLIAGVAMLGRLWLFEHSRVSNSIHFVCVMVCVGWCASWYAGPETTAIPAYTFVAVCCVGLPFIHPLASRYLKLTPRAKI